MQQALSTLAKANGLTARELQILFLLAEGYANKEIADRMNIATGTVRNRLQLIYAKLQVRCRAEAAAKYFGSSSTAGKAVRTGCMKLTSDIEPGRDRSFSQPILESLSRADLLTPREAEILALLIRGLSNKDIGAQLRISLGTVRVHLTHLYKKLRVVCRTQAAAKYHQTKPKVGVKETV